MNNFENVDQKDVIIKRKEDPYSINIWYSALLLMLKCFDKKIGFIYFYHTRKAAGTTITSFLFSTKKIKNIPVEKTEGIIIDQLLLNKTDIFKVINIREPISRIKSLYWFEHVSWFDKNNKTNCRPMKEWIDTWRDGSSWKNSFLIRHPRNNFVEIENYYVKLLIGWDGQSAITENDFNKAKTALNKFDLILIFEWLGEGNKQDQILNKMFINGQTVQTHHHKNRLDPFIKSRLSHLVRNYQVL